MANTKKKHFIDPVKLDQEIDVAREKHKEENWLEKPVSKKEFLRLCWIGWWVSWISQDKRDWRISESREVRLRKKWVVTGNFIIQG